MDDGGLLGWRIALSRHDGRRGCEPTVARAGVAADLPSLTFEGSLRDTNATDRFSPNPSACLLPPRICICPPQPLSRTPVSCLSVCLSVCPSLRHPPSRPRHAPMAAPDTVVFLLGSCYCCRVLLSSRAARCHGGRAEHRPGDRVHRGLGARAAPERHRRVRRLEHDRLQGHLHLRRSANQRTQTKIVLILNTT